MVWLILALLLGVVLASIVVGLVAVPARREGRSVLTEHGESMVSGLTERTDKLTGKMGRGASGLASSVTRRRAETNPAAQTSEAPANTEGAAAVASDKAAQTTDAAPSAPGDGSDHPEASAAAEPSTDTPTGAAPGGSVGKAS